MPNLKYVTMDVTKPYKLVGLGDAHGPKPYKFIRFGDTHGPKPHTFIGGWVTPMAPNPINLRNMESSLGARERRWRVSGGVAHQGAAGGQ